MFSKFAMQYRTISRPMFPVTVDGTEPPKLARFVVQFLTADGRVTRAWQPTLERGRLGRRRRVVRATLADHLAWARENGETVRIARVISR
jgi:hypothetical protein